MSKWPYFLVFDRCTTHVFEQPIASLVTTSMLQFQGQVMICSGHNFDSYTFVVLLCHPEHCLFFPFSTWMQHLGSMPTSWYTVLYKWIFDIWYCIRIAKCRRFRNIVLTSWLLCLLYHSTVTVSPKNSRSIVCAATVIMTKRTQPTRYDTILS
jgi:hypothetical protein